MNHLAAAFLVIGVITAVYFPSQSDFGFVLISTITAFIGYFFLIFKASPKLDLKFLLLLGVLIRIVLIPAFPNLSDDIYRFIWDGRLMHLGLNPFDDLPSNIMLNDPLLQELKPLLNSPDYYTIYPPVAQFVFYISTWASDLSHFSLIFKTIFFLFELGTLWLLIKLVKTLDVNPQKIMYYWLNPLIMIELMGNIHFEALMVFFFLFFILALTANKMELAGLAYGLSIATKLLPLMFGPFILIKLIKEQRFLKFASIATAFLIFVFGVFFFNANFLHLLSSVDLYFQKFEFNASVYYIFRSIGIWLKGYNQIHIVGPLLSILTLSVILFLSTKVVKNNMNQFVHLCFAAFCLYLFFGTTVHPWYLALPLVLNVFLGYRFILVWSALIFLSYSCYMTPEFNENLFLVFAEYSMVLAIFLKFDLPNIKKLQINNS